MNGRRKKRREKKKRKNGKKKLAESNAGKQNNNSVKEWFGKTQASKHREKDKIENRRGERC